MKKGEIADLRAENVSLREIAKQLHWMARRYADGRSTYCTSMFNEYTRILLALDINLNPTGDGTIWARDGMGRRFDRLTDEEAALGQPPDWYRSITAIELTPDEREAFEAWRRYREERAAGQFTHWATCWRHHSECAEGRVEGLRQALTEIGGLARGGRNEGHRLGAHAWREALAEIARRADAAGR